MQMMVNYKPKHFISADQVFSVLKEHLCLDGFSIVPDLYSSTPNYFVDKLTQSRFKDFFTCYASLPIGMNHPKMLEESYLEYLKFIAINKPSNSDLYTEELATFVNTLFRIAVPDYFKYAFFIEGGALAVENALKTAFDWKVQKNFRKGYREELGHQIIHFQQAFHGRSGYTMSLTNTDDLKIKYFPKFKWPRIINPKMTFPFVGENELRTLEAEKLAIEQIKKAFKDNPNDIAAIIIEPIQGEGGDNHFRPEFLQQLRFLADENECLLIFDEVQTGVGITGTMWVHEQMNVQPDILVFGKKMQVCGIIVGSKIDDIPTNVFYVHGRINSTWGGNLTDMVRATRYLEIIEEDNLLQNSCSIGKILLNELKTLQQEFPNLISNARGRGLFCAFDLPNKEIRKIFLQKAFENHLLILPCGELSIRFRPSLTVEKDQILEGIEIIRGIIKAIRY